MAVKRFNLPDPGEGLVEAEIVTWKVKVGDTVKVNDIIVEIETAKSLVELPVPYAGTVAALLVSEGDTVEVGTPIIAVDDGRVGDVAVGAAPPSAAGSAAGESGVNTSNATTSNGTTSNVGTSGATTSDATTPGATTPDADQKPQAATAGDAAPADRVANLVGYGPRVTGTKRRARKGEGAAATTSAQLNQAFSPVPIPASVPAPAVPVIENRSPEPGETGHVETDLLAKRPDVVSTVPGGRALAKPPVRKLAKDLGIDLSQVSGSGERGIVTRADVEAYAAAATPGGTAASTPDGLSVGGSSIPGGASSAHWTMGSAGFAGSGERETRIPIKGVRKMTAEAMVASAFTAPHVTEFITVDVTRMMKLVDRLRTDPEFRDVKVSPLLVVAKALILASRRHPGVNATWDEAAQEIVVKNYVNLGIAAATPRGLMVPNIKDADRMSLRQLAEALTNLVSTAREGRTQPADMSGGSITITNVGIFGVDTGTPILNPGEAAILCFGAVRQMPWVVKGKVKPRWVTQLALSFDHRLVDGDLGSRFLADLAAILHDPSQALIWA
jgi:2-oxoisovalerate dehydrogenase E2 component (dihydrolipoyl transacylase)